jgi:hypothetical protein
MVLPWQHPFTCLVSGPTSCGKTVFVSKFLEHLDQMVDIAITEIIWCYGEPQPFHDHIHDAVIAQNKTTTIQFRAGCPSLDDLVLEASHPPPRLLVVDDQMREASSNMVDLFSKGSHHKNMSVMFITQNLFHQSKSSRDMSLNAHYIIVFKNPRDKSQINYFARQVFPENPKFVQEAFVDATSEPHSYLLFDMKQNTPEAFRIRAKIFPDESQFVYVPKKASTEFAQYYYSPL